MLLLNKLAELRDNGFCVLKQHYAAPLIDATREAFWPILLNHLEVHRNSPNRGPHRHFLPMPFEPPCFAGKFFFNPLVLSIVRGAMDERIVADQWGCDAPLKGSTYQEVHVDYRRPLFPKVPDLALPTYMLMASFGRIDITLAHAPIEIAPGTHRMGRQEALQTVQSGQINLEPISMEIGDVLIRHPWTLHRGTPNTTDMPRALLTIRFVRRWYADASRDINSIPLNVWNSFTPEAPKP